MTLSVLAPLVASLALGDSPAACVADSTAPRLDHVIIAVQPHPALWIRYRSAMP